MKKQKLIDVLKTLKFSKTSKIHAAMSNTDAYDEKELAGLTLLTKPYKQNEGGLKDLVDDILNPKADAKPEPTKTSTSTRASERNRY